MEFETIPVEQIDSADQGTLERLDFGVIGFGPTTEVDIFLSTESRLAGLPRESVLGRQFLAAIASCMNTDLVSARLEREATLDEMIDYALPLGMLPMPTKLRLLKSPSSERALGLTRR